MQARPNILFFLTDDQRFDTIHALGNKEIITPNMDRLVQNGTTFRHAYIPGGTSAAVCMPSRAMLHTGRTLFHLQGEGQQIPESHTTLGEAFKSAGYRTFGTGKWHNGISSYTRSFTDGASIFFGGMWDHWNVPLCEYDPSGSYNNLIPFTHNFMNSNHPMNVHCDYYSTGKHSTEVLSESAVNFIQQYHSADPFFMYISFLAPHDPRSMPKEFIEMYDAEKISPPENFSEEHPWNYGVREIRDEYLASYPREKTEIRKHIAEYYAMITHLDHEIGQVLEVLEKSGQADNTIIVLAGDNGLAVGQHGLMGKQSHYDHSIRVPLIFCGPGIPKGVQLENYAYLLDVFPTLCQLCHFDIPCSVEGKSLVSMMKNPELKLRETLYFAYNDLIRSVKDERYKLIEYVGPVRTTQLFDLKTDPHETHNLYGKGEYATIVSRLRNEMIKHRDQWEDTLHPLGKRFWKNY